MNLKNYLKKMESLPDLMENSVLMDEPNSIVKVYEGLFLINSDARSIEVRGEISFRWFPSPNVVFKGEPTDEKFDLFTVFESSEEFTLVINKLDFGVGFITNYTTGATNYLKGIISKHSILGDESIPVEKVRFSVPNLRAFFGEPVKKKSDKNLKASRNRLILENERCTIVLDKCDNFQERKKSLNQSGGYIILYNGELTLNREKVSHANIKNVLKCLNNFLFFLNGRRTSAMFIQGIFNGNIIWTDFSNFYVDQYKFVRTWPAKNSTTGFSELWNKFCAIWKNKNDRNFLTSVIHWYVEANSHSGFSEGSLIMAQTALELIYNWWIIESKGLILGKDSENISASNKIRLLLSQLNTSNSVPPGLEKLHSFVVQY